MFYNYIKILINRNEKDFKLKLLVIKKCVYVCILCVYYN